MILFALALTAASATGSTDLQIMISPAFQRFASRAERMCPARKLRFLTPGDLDSIEEGFEAQLAPRTLRRLNAADDHGKTCHQQAVGLSCPAQHTLDAMARVRLLPSFTRFACSQRH